MINYYQYIDNEFYIFAPGNPNNNKLKNHLIWDINSALSAKFRLLQIEREKLKNEFTNLVHLGLFSRYSVHLVDLDHMLIDMCEVNVDDIKVYRDLIDPKRKMNEEIFYELCCLENIDIEYVALMKDTIIESNNKIFKSYRSINEWARTAFPVYISLFGAKEMVIVINDINLLEQIRKIVDMHCLCIKDS